MKTLRGFPNYLIKTIDRIYSSCLGTDSSTKTDFFIKFIKKGGAGGSELFINIDVTNFVYFLRVVVTRELEQQGVVRRGRGGRDQPPGEGDREAEPRRKGRGALNPSFREAPAQEKHGSNGLCP